MPDAGAHEHTPEQAAGSDDGEIVVGVLSCNNSESVGPVVQAAREGLSSCFPDRRCLLVNADGGSKDGTLDVAKEAAGAANFLQIEYPAGPMQRLLPGWLGVPSRMSAIRAICEVANQRNAAVCVVIDSNVKSMAQDWIGALGRPVVERHFDFVTPCYLRHKFDGAILSGIVYPFTRALYGKRIQQPTGGEIALSANLIRYFLHQGDDPAGDDSISDFRLTIHAVAGRFRMAQSFLGPRVLRDGVPPPEVSSILAYTLSPLFSAMEQTATLWQRVRGSEAVPAFGACGDSATEPASIDINPMIQSFQLGYRNLQEIWRTVLPPATWMELRRMAGQTAESFRFDNTIWARVVYDFALGWKMRVIDRDHLLRALTPLYLAWVASWVRTVRDADAIEIRDAQEALCSAFETQKGYFISRWRWPDRFNP